MSTVLAFASVIGITAVVFGTRARHRGAPVDLAASGAAAFGSGLLTLMLMTGNLATLILPAMAFGEPVDYLSLSLAFAVTIAGLLCLRLATALTRGELHAQKRTLGSALVILGVTLPLSASDPAAALMACSALVHVGALLFSRTHIRQLSEPAASPRC